MHLELTVAPLACGALEGTLRFLAEADWLRQGEDFFRALARFLAGTLELDYVCIDRLEGDALSARTLAVWHDGGFEPDVAYSLADTPCGQAVGRALCLFPEGVRRLFPRDEALQELEAESYLGATLWNTRGHPIGLIALISRRPFGDLDTAEAVLSLVSHRAAAELEVRLAQEAARLGEARVRSMLRTALDGVWLLDRDGRILEVNEAACRMTGWSREEFLERRVTDLVAAEVSLEIPGRVERIRAQGSHLFESTHRRKDGSLYPVEVSVTSLPDEDWMVAFVRDITERKETERRLRESEEVFARTFQAAQVMMALVDLDSHRVLDVNEAFVRCSGFSRSEVIGLSAQDFGWLSPEDQEALRGDLLREGQVRNRFVTHRAKDGRAVHGLFSGTVLPLGGRRVVLVTTQDLTGIRMAEEALREREELLRLSLEGADLGAWDWDIPSGRVSVNDRWLEMLGYSRDGLDLAVGTWEGWIHPEDHDQTLRLLQAHLRGETSAYESEHRLRHANGEWVWVLGRGRVIKRGPAGEPLRMCGTHLDLTEWKWSALLEAARLRLAEFSLGHSLDELMQAAVDEACALTGSPIGFYHQVEGEEQTIVLHAWSTRTEREFCTAAGKGTHYAVASAGIWADCLRERRPVIHNDYPSHPGRRGLPPGHAPVEREMVVPLSRSGRIVAMLGVGNKAEPYGAHDLQIVQRLIDHAWTIVERKRAELSQRELERQLQQVQKMESLGNLAGGVAHDLNNVLGAILSLSTVLREKLAEADPSAGALDTITRACLRGRDVVRGLLSFARRDLEEERPVDLNALVRDLVGLLAHTTLQRVELVMDLQEPLPRVKADGSALSHTLMNLCVNAVDAMPQGGTLHLATRRAPEGGLSLQVRDTGTGMTEEVMARALEPFYTTKPPGKGTGLGLSMAYGTLKAHGGSLELRSRPGEGTEITLNLPAWRVEPAPAAEGASPAKASGNPRSLGILLVDDDPLVREAAAPMLEVLGHSVRMAASGEDALRMLEQGAAPDLVILDMNMPGLTGAEVLPRLRALWPELPVMIATGFVDEEIQALAESRPRLRIIEKPYDLAELRRKVAALLG